MCAVKRGPTRVDRSGPTTGRGSAWLERLVRDQEVAGSNPVAPIFLILANPRLVFLRIPAVPAVWLNYPRTTPSRKRLPPCRRKKVPQYCLHKGSGQAYVKIDGRRIYLGSHNSTESKCRYSEEIDRWRELQECGRLPDIRVGELILIYLEKHVRRHYVKTGRPTSEQFVVQAALRFLAKHRHVLCADFGPRLLKDVRADIVRSGLARETVNRYAAHIRQMFEWAVSEELIPERVYVSLKNRESPARRPDRCPRPREGQTCADRVRRGDPALR